MAEKHMLVLLHPTHTYVALSQNAPQRRAGIPSAQSGAAQNMPRHMASERRAECEVVKSDHSNCQTFWSHSEIADLQHSYRAEAPRPTPCPCA